jgi:hypothetical protein
VLVEGEDDEWWMDPSLWIMSDSRPADYETHSVFYVNSLLKQFAYNIYNNNVICPLYTYTCEASAINIIWFDFIWNVCS